jgi:asparagine synthase (glutamine-hydrolysing)
VRRILPGRLRRRAIGTLARLYPKLDRAPRFLRAKHTLTELSLESALGYAATVTRLNQAERRALFSPELNAALNGYDPTARFLALLDESGTDDALAQAQYMDLNTWLPGDILVKVDRASMANSLEVRAPFLDHRLVSWGLSLPTALKLHHGVGKHLLKQALEPLLPRALLYRPKQGFATSQAALFRASTERLRQRLLAPPMIACSLFVPTTIARLIDEHAAGAFDHSQKLWLLLAFEAFLVGQAGLADDVSRSPVSAAA